MAGKKGRSGRVPKNLLNYKARTRANAQVVLDRYVRRIMQMSDDDLLDNPRMIEHVMQIELKAQDIEARKETAQIETAPLLALLERAKESNDYIDVTPEQKLIDNIAEESASPRTDEQAK